MIEHPHLDPPDPSEVCFLCLKDRGELVDESGLVNKPCASHAESLKAEAAESKSESWRDDLI